jgi:hypothetical protein
MADVPVETTLSLVDTSISDVIALPQADAFEEAKSNETIQAVNAATLPMIAEPLPVPVTSELQADARVPVTHPQGRLRKTDEPGQADWKAIGIGIVTGSLVSGVIFLATSQLHIFNQVGRLVLWAGEMFLGVVGALIANSWKSTPRELWQAAITWTLDPVWFALLIGLIILLLMFTSLTG